MSEAVAAVEVAAVETGLTDAEAALLDFEAAWAASAGSLATTKEAAVLARFGLSSPRYHQELNALVDRPEALAHAPVLVTRLRRLREKRRERRSARHLGVRSTV